MLFACKKTKEKFIDMTEPIELLKQRLKEIESIDCDDENFLELKNKYKITIDFLRYHGVCQKKWNKQLTLSDVNYLYYQYLRGEKLDFLAKIFNTSRATAYKEVLKFKRNLINTRCINKFEK